MRLELFFKRKHAGRQLFNSNLMIEFTSSAVSGPLFASSSASSFKSICRWASFLASSESPFEDDQVFAVYEFFHSVLLSRGRSFNFVTSGRLSRFDVSSQTRTS
jgi:hypothetical protein